MLDRDAVKRASRLEEIVPTLTGQTLHRSNGQAEPQICCPWHDDGHPSLRISIDKQLWRCDPCKIGGDVFDFVERHQSTDFPGALRFLAERAGLHGTPRREVAAYDYVDEAGTILYQSVRFEPKGFSQRRPDGRGGWTWNLKDTRRVVYRLHDIQGKEAVVVVEGEKDANALWTIGIPATCNVGGAGKWKNEYSRQLSSAGVKRVVVIPDHDSPGRQHAEQVAQSGTKAGLAVKLLVLPGLSDRGDVSDYLAKHAKTELIALLKAAPPYVPADSNPAPTTPQSSSALRATGSSRRAVEKAPQQGRSVAAVFDDPETWPEPVDLSQLLDEVREVVTRFVVLPEGAADAVVLWIAFTYLMDVWQVAPNLAGTSPTKQCGKTRLLQVVKGLAYRALPCSSMTGAVLFRVIEKYGPTLLIDEAENALNEQNDEVYALLNAGHTRDTAIAIRTVGDKHEPAIFSTWAPKMFALIGKLRDTAMDRSIVIPMRRRKEGETVAPMRAGAFATLCLPIRRRLLRWSDDARERVAAIEPTFPPGLRDRAQDNWSALFMIAHLAGPTWLERAHQSALLLSGGAESNDDSPATQLLEDCRTIFDEVGGEVIGSTKLVELLNGLEGRPYADRQHGKGVTTAWLAKQLRTFEIQTAGTVRMGTKTAKGYRWSAFEDSWSRFLPPRDDCDGSNLSCDGKCDGLTPQIQPMNTEDCYGVTAVTAVQGRGEREQGAL